MTRPETGSQMTRPEMGSQIVARPEKGQSNDQTRNGQSDGDQTRNGQSEKMIRPEVGILSTDGDNNRSDHEARGCRRGFHRWMNVVRDKAVR